MHSVSCDGSMATADRSKLARISKARFATDRARAWNCALVQDARGGKGQAFRLKHPSARRGAGDLLAKDGACGGLREGVQELAEAGEEDAAAAAATTAAWFGVTFVGEADGARMAPAGLGGFALGSSSLDLDEVPK
jgi:hypothetical protein